MTALARHAAARLPTPGPCTPTTCPAAGFMVFEAPLATYVNNEGREVWIFSHPAPALPREAFTGGIADRAALAPLMSTVPVRAENLAHVTPRRRAGSAADGPGSPLGCGPGARGGIRRSSVR
jgi:hypothetical protein